MIESFVDLTYRGLSLGRRIKLTQVRPSRGTLELPIPMPVGTHVTIAADDGVTFDATVSWVHEQVAGSDRTPGMIVVPALAADPALSWWQARVALPDEDKPKPRPPRNRPVTVRPRSQTEPGPPPEEAITDEIPTMIRDLDARVAAAAGADHSRPGGGPGGRPTTVMNALDQEMLKQLTRSADGEPTTPSGGPEVSPGVPPEVIPVVIDDGQKTVLMEAIDPSTLGLDPGASSGDPGATDDSDGSEADEADEADEAGETGETTLVTEVSEVSGGDKPPPGRGFFKKRKKRR